MNKIVPFGKLVRTYHLVLEWAAQGVRLTTPEGRIMKTTMRDSLPYIHAGEMPY
jgi:hypothetical protein